MIKANYLLLNNTIDRSIDVIFPVMMRSQQVKEATANRNLCRQASEPRWHDSHERRKSIMTIDQVHITIQIRENMKRFQLNKLNHEFGVHACIFI